MSDMSHQTGSWIPEATGPSPAPGQRPDPSGGSAAVGGAGANRAPVLVAGGLLVVAVALHVASLFPAQGRGVAAFDAQAALVVQQVVLAVGWLIAASLVLSAGRVMVGAGAVIAAGIGAAELGVVATNLAQVLSESTASAGAWLFVAAWVVGTVGAVAAAVIALRGAPRGAQGHGGAVGPDAAGSRALAAATAIIAVVLGVALLPAWDHYVITSSTLHRTLGTESLGSAFAKTTPGAVLAGDILTALAFAVVPILALRWRRPRLAVLLSGGVLVVVAAQVASAVVGFQNTPGFFGFTAAQVTRYGIRVQSSLTAWFVIEMFAGVALVLLAGSRWWATTSHWTGAPPPDFAPPTYPPPERLPPPYLPGDGGTWPPPGAGPGWSAGPGTGGEPGWGARPGWGPAPGHGQAPPSQTPPESEPGPAKPRTWAQAPPCGAAAPAVHPAPAVPPGGRPGAQPPGDRGAAPAGDRR
jgi:hypothetical protein